MRGCGRLRPAMLRRVNSNDLFFFLSTRADVLVACPALCVVNSNNRMHTITSRINCYDLCSRSQSSPHRLLAGLN